MKPKPTVAHVWRAFWRALGMTLRGETPPPPPPRHPELQAWMDEALHKLDLAYAVCDKNGMSAEQRQRVSIPIKPRPMNMEVILAGLRYHLTQEYPKLLATPIEGALTTIVAANVDDRYRVRKLAEQWQDTPFAPALRALADHLDAIPPLKEPELA